MDISHGHISVSCKNKILQETFPGNSCCWRAAAVSSPSYLCNLPYPEWRSSSRGQSANMPPYRPGPRAGHVAAYHSGRTPRCTRRRRWALHARHRVRQISLCVLTLLFAFSLDFKFIGLRVTTFENTPRYLICFHFSNHVRDPDVRPPPL